MSRNREEILARRSKLSPEKRALLEKRMRGELESDSRSITIPRRSSTEPAPLSFSQARLWFLQQLEPESAVYNETAAIRLTGSLNVTALKQSLNEMVRRHEALHTTFEMVEGQPVQVIAPIVTVTLPVVNLCELPEAEQNREVQRLVTEVSQRPFDLSQAPLLRWTLLQLGERDYVLLFTVHHIIFDGWSGGVIVRELAALYAAFSSGKPSPLPDLPIQYADFAVWQRQWLQGEVLRTQFAYWQQQLSSPPPVLQLPTDRPRPAVQTFRGAMRSFSVSGELTEALEALSQKEDVTLFMTLLAAFKTLLYRYTRTEDIAIGSPIANRDRTELEGLIGCFVNTLVLRTELSNNPSFRLLLSRVREVALGAYAHQDLPFEKLVEELQPQRDLSYTPLFQVMFVLQNEQTIRLQLPDLTLSSLESNNGTAKFELTLSVEKTAEGLIGTFEYNTDLFEAATIERMVEHLQQLLAGIVANPEQRLMELPLLTDSERHQLLVEWNDTQVEYPQTACIHQLFEAQAERTPDAIAVVFEDQQLTYQELNTKADQLARYLQKLGVKPEVLVGICIERSNDMVVGLLGILKAGGAYVPLDPAYPKERLAFMLSDSQVPVLLTESKLVAALPEHQAKVVCLDTDWEEISKGSDRYFPSPVTPENLAYAIYTSGSTGQPKGVQIPHRALVNCLSALRDTLELTEGDILLSVTTLSFDIAALELYLPLIVSARVVIVSREVAADGTQLLERLASSRATVMQATPATWRLLLAAGWQGSWSLKILCGGEALDRELGDRLLERGTELWNVYGPTETTIWSAAHKVEKSTDRRDAVVSIGRPIANTQFYVLDQQRQPVPVGVIGELYIGGLGLARGYLNRAELTTEKFISNPFQKSKGSNRLYKTGDLVRYRPDGSLEYLGRVDFQVKVRGFRIELGEIEAVLNQHPVVQANAVVVWEDELGFKGLVAYVVLQPEQAPTVSELRRFLVEKLPSYMVPSTFAILEELPLTPNDKIDRRALPAPNAIATPLEAAFVAPRNSVEEELAKIWAEVLGVEQVGVCNNFFEIGGHSLLATQVMSRVWQTFQVELPLRRLFESPTVAGLAEAIREAMKAKPEREAPPIVRVSREGNLPLSFAQARLWLLEQLQPNRSTYNIPAAVKLVGSLNVAVLEQTLCEIVRRHEALRTAFRVVDGQPVQAIAPAPNLKLSVVDLCHLPETERDAEIQQLATEEAQRPFDLSRGPLVRSTLLRVGETEHIVLFTIHHIVSDGWSMGVFVRELAALYKAFYAGQPSPLPELPIQYADFAVWQRQWLQGAVLEEKLTYWKQQLGSNLPVLQLPTACPRTEVKTNRGATKSFVIPSNLSQALQALSRQEGVTLFMTLLAGFQVLLQRYTNQDDIVVGTDVANRNRAETESLIGFFVNLLVLRTDLSGNPSFRELLQRVREVALGAYAHQDVPFEKLVEALQPGRNLNNAPPLFQVLFVLQNTPMPALELPGLTLDLLEVETEVTRFDLALFLTETEQGILGTWQYNADLFETQTITRLSGHLQTLFESIVTQLDARINTLEMLSNTEREQQAVKKMQHKTSKLKKFLAVQPKPVELSSERLVETDYLKFGETLPLLITPKVNDIDVVGWAKNNRDFLEEKLLHHGAILFRNFSLKSSVEFESLSEVICPNLFGEYGDLPREGISGKVYGSTPYPSEQAILFHNESSHMHCWPQKIWFFCVQPARQGGETPIVDSRKIFQLLDPKLREKFEQKQLMYVRNYTNGLDVSWQEFFHTTDKAEVENYCRKASISVQWKPDGSLRTQQVRPAVVKHPKTKEPVFFNQIQLHHISCLKPEVKESLLSSFGEDNLPRHVYYGDRTPIEDSVIEEILAVYEQAQVSFAWQQGDVLMLDNMLTAHGRNPYVGPRKIVVAMGEMVDSGNLERKGMEKTYAN